MITRILGIDPGSHRLGIACVEKTGSKYHLVFAETIEAPAKESLYPRLQVISERLESLLDALNPQEIAVEDLFHARNARSAFHLGMARGVAIGACLKRKMKIFEYAPAQVKAVVAGYGRADKAQIKKMVELTLGCKLVLGHDATDAIAVAICHGSSRGLEAALAASERLTLRP
jgi:crossover junction endodeoxyribonuclease RuvC